MVCKFCRILQTLPLKFVPSAVVHHMKILLNFADFAIQFRLFCGCSSHENFAEFCWFCHSISSILRLVSNFKFCWILLISQFNFVHIEICHQSSSSSLFFIEDFAGLREICTRRRANKADAQQGPRRRWPNRRDPQQGPGRCRRLRKFDRGIGDRWEYQKKQPPVPFLARSGTKAQQRGSPPSVLVHGRGRPRQGVRSNSPSKG